jgi:hypothetical protein
MVEFLICVGLWIGAIGAITALVSLYFEND